MDVMTYIQQQMANARGQVDAALSGLTDEQFNWLPPGTIGPISSILAHMLGGEDFFVQEILQGKPRCWETQGWAKKIGVPRTPGPDGGWEWFRTTQVTTVSLLAYQKAVRKATDACLASLTSKKLDRKIKLMGKVIPVADVLMITVVHLASHAGEIAAVKGMQWIKGLPF